MTLTAKVTVIFLLYNAQESVSALVEAALRQRHPRFPRQSDWLHILFMDDCSRDETLPRLRSALEAAGSPSHCTIEANETNLGLSSTLNKAFGMVRTPYGLTCHLDVLFGCDDYVAQMLLLMEDNPDAGAITGQPRIPEGSEISMVEKLNLICNLMDIIPADAGDELVPVGFAEGRCDIFRVDALAKAGFWDTTLRASGEDQVLALRMRQNGYNVYQARHLPYYLSVSGEQDSLRKLLRHARLFGRTQPYILLHDRKALASSAGPEAGTNRRARMMLRCSHVAGTAAFLATVACFAAGVSILTSLAPVVAVALLKGFLFRRHLAAVPLKLGEVLFFVAFVPLQDVYYTVGLLQGVWAYFRGSAGRIIE